MNNCVLLPIEADNQNTALGIFTTLNDRGRPLFDSDIFKAQFYKFYLKQGSVAKNNFVQRWKTLAELCNKNFHPRKGTHVDDLFRRYMYYAKTRQAIEQEKRISDTFSDMRDFYAEDNYKLLRDEKTFADLEWLANFWDDVAKRKDRFPSSVLKKLYVLSYSPYSLWGYVVSLYVMSNRELDEEKFCAFLDKTTAMILMNAVLDLGKQNIRRPFVLEFKKIFHGEPLEFNKQFKRSEKILRGRLSEMIFSNAKPITRAMLAWRTFNDPEQKLPPPDVKLEQEHIYAKKRHELNPKELSNPDTLEFLGNKALLEERINIRAADYRFTENLDDFTENDILKRNEEIFNAFVAYLRENNLLD